MQSRWNDTDSALAAAEAKAAGLPVRLGLRAYAGRLLGQDGDLAPHGGDISVKIEDAEGGPVIHVSAAGLDLGDMTPAGLPAARLADATPVDPKAAAQSAQAALHAALPYPFVDRIQPTAVLVLANQPDIAATVAGIYGDALAIVAPSPDLASACLAACKANPQAEGLWLGRDGLLTFGATARESYERMIRLSTLAADHIAARGIALPGPEETDLSPPDDLAYRLSEALAEQGALGKPALDFRSTPSIRRWLERDSFAALIHRGPAAPDHIALIKPFGMILPADANLTAIRLALMDHAEDCRNWLDRHGLSVDDGDDADPLPRAVLVPGLGVYGIGKDAKAAAVAGDLLEQTARIVNAAEDYGRFAPMPDAAEG